MGNDTSYYEGINSGENYLCDRCEVAKLSHAEYTNNHNVSTGNRYCEECTNYIIIRKWKCNTCKSTGSMRNERILPKVCCEENVIWLK